MMARFPTKIRRGLVLAGCVVAVSVALCGSGALAFRGGFGGFHGGGFGGFHGGAFGGFHGGGWGGFRRAARLSRLSHDDGSLDGPRVGVLLATHTGYDVSFHEGSLGRGDDSPQPVWPIERRSQSCVHVPQVYTDPVRYTSTTNFAPWEGNAKPRPIEPCAGLFGSDAVSTPTTFPLQSSSDPPELAGFIAASIWCDIVQ